MEGPELLNNPDTNSGRTNSVAFASTDVPNPKRHRVQPQ
jgi:hypothetical protein